MSDPALTLRGLTKSYGARRGIAGIDLDVRRGEAFGFLGPNGAGKTTTIRILLDLIRPTAGSAEVLGLDTRTRGIEVRRRTGYLPGDLNLPAQPTGRDYLGHLASLRGGVVAGSVEALAERLGCDLDTRIRTLSHGNRQKIGLVQALMHRPEVLILDEPTQGLDPLVQHEFQRIVREVTAAGSTVFLSSHVLPEVQALCDRVGMVREGRLVAVEDIGVLAARALRTVEFHFAQRAPLAAFTHLPGVRHVEAHGDVVHCQVVGPLDAVVKAAARFEVLDVISHEAGLDEVFMQLYQERPRDVA